VCLGWLIWRKEEIAESHTLPDFCWITFDWIGGYHDGLIDDDLDVYDFMNGKYS
jgi:hypothetical protein